MCIQFLKGRMGQIQAAKPPTKTPTHTGHNFITSVHISKEMRAVLGDLGPWSEIQLRLSSEVGLGVSILQVRYRRLGCGIDRTRVLCQWLKC